MSQFKKRRLLQCHKALKRKLKSLGLLTLEDAKALLGCDFVEQTEVLGRTYTLTVRADDFEDEIVVGAWLTSRAMPCGESYSCGFSFKNSAKPTYLSQKKLWAHGY